MKQSCVKLLVMASICSLFLLGCGQREEISDKDSQTFKSAIVKYCQSKNMGMEVKSFDKIDINGGKATIIARMKAKEGPGITAKWTFSAEKKDGAWIIDNHSR